MRRPVFLAFSIIGVVLGLVSAEAAAQQRDAVPDTTQLMRPVEILDGDIRWNRASTDLFTYWIDNDLYGFYGPQPDIFIDGLPVDANFFGWQNLNMLPVASTTRNGQYRFPGMHFGHYAPAGALNFNHGTVDTGLTVTGSFYAGNESGDPGPYVYDSLMTTPNIDRWGPDTQLSLAYRTGGWYARGHWVRRNHFPTDLASNGRLHFTASLLGTNTAYVNHRIYANTESGLMEGGYRDDRWHLRTRAVYGKSKDYLFLQPFGREIPVQTGYRQVAADLSYKLGSWTLNGRYIGHQKTAEKRIDLHPYIFDWDQRNHTAGLSALYEADGMYIKHGFSYERRKTYAPGLSNGMNDLLTLYVDATVPVGDDSKLTARVNTDYDEEQVAKTLDFSGPTVLSEHWKIIPRLLHAEVLPIRQHAFSYWVNRGYSFAEELGIPYFTSARVDINRLTKYSLRNHITLHPDVVVTLQPELIDHQALNVPYQPVEPYEFVTDTRPGSFNVTQEKGNRLLLYGEIKHTYGHTFTHAFAVNLQRTLSGSDRYRSYFRQVPETKVQYRLQVTPTPDLALSMNALYRSATTWNEFDAIEGNEYKLPSGIPIREVTGTFHSKTPAYTDITLGVQKWFWDRRLSTQFTLRNLLNQELRMHPLGADLNTKFDLQVSLSL